MIIDTNIGRGIFGGVIAILFYGLSFWRIFKNNRGSRIVECGTLTIMVLVTLAFLMKIVDLPDWAFGLFLLLLFLLCMLTLFFVAQRGYYALRRRSKAG